MKNLTATEVLANRDTRRFDYVVNKTISKMILIAATNLGPVIRCTERLNVTGGIKS